MLTVGNLAQDKSAIGFCENNNGICFADFCGQLKQRHFLNINFSIDFIIMKLFFFWWNKFLHS